jgi:hypothetical protein
MKAPSSDTPRLKRFLFRGSVDMYRRSVDLVRVVGERVGRLHLPDLQCWGVDYRLDQLGAAADEGRVEVDLAGDEPAAVLRPDQVWRLAPGPLRWGAPGVRRLPFQATDTALPGSALE